MTRDRRRDARSSPPGRPLTGVEATLHEFGRIRRPARGRPHAPHPEAEAAAAGAFKPRLGGQTLRARSIEHAFLTPVFGTAQPRKGLSGVLRGVAYRRYSEARAAHWLLLIAADRVDAAESHLASLLRLHPDPVLATGVLSEVSRGGPRSRVGRGRADLAHQPLDPVVVGAPWVASAVAVWLGVRALRRR